MGYGEVGGGGSVHMRMLDKGKNEKAKGKDPDPEPSKGGDFHVIVNGVLVSSPAIDFDNPRQILIVWPPHKWVNGQILDENNQIVAEGGVSIMLKPPKTGG